ncbi:aldehyde dehydrogenase, partial [Streptosporangium algeriense]
MTDEIVSVIGGKQASGSPGGVYESVNPARLDEVVARVGLAVAETFVSPSRTAAAAQAEWA